MFLNIIQCNGLLRGSEREREDEREESERDSESEDRKEGYKTEKWEGMAQYPWRTGVE